MGRADLLCGFLSVIALFLTITGTRLPGNASGNNKRVRDDKSSDRAGGVVTTRAPAPSSGVVGECPTRNGTLSSADAAEKTPTASVSEPPQDGEEIPEAEREICPVAATATSAAVFDETAISWTSALEQTTVGVSGDEAEHRRQGNEGEGGQNQEGEEGMRTEGTTAHGRGAAGTAPSLPPSRRPSTTAAAMVHPEEQPRPETIGAAVVGEKDTGPGVSRFCAALLLAAGATLCKEVGVTVFGLMAGGELVRFLEQRDWRQRQRQRRRGRGRGSRSTEPTAENHAVSGRMVAREGECRRPTTRVPLAAATRAASAAVGAVTMVVLHVRLHGGAGVRDWGVLENDISILARWAPGVALIL